MKPRFSVFALFLALGLSVCSSSFAKDKDDVGIQEEAEVKLASLSQKVSSDSGIKDKDKALKKLVSDYVKAMNKAYKKVEKDEETLEKGQRKLRQDAKELDRKADDMEPLIANAKVSEDKGNHGVVVAELVEQKFKQGIAGKTQ